MKKKSLSAFLASRSVAAPGFVKELATCEPCSDGYSSEVMILNRIGEIAEPRSFEPFPSNAMSVQEAVQILASIQFLVIGLSHIVAARTWAEFFLLLRDHGRAGVFVVAFMSLWFGAIVVAFHNVWSGVPLVLTVIGWAQVLKAFIYFLFPDVALRRLKIVSLERAHIFVYPGVVFVVMAIALAWHVWVH